MSDFCRRWSVENTAPSSEQLLTLLCLLLLKPFSHCGPCLKVPSGGKPSQAGTTILSKRSGYSQELGWIFREITPSLQDAIICNFLALSQISEKKWRLWSYQSQSKLWGVDKNMLHPLNLRGSLKKKKNADGFNLFGKCSHREWKDEIFS